MIKWLERKKILPINMVAGDSLVLSHTDPETGKDVEVLRRTIDELIVVDEVGVFKLEDEHGFRKAIGGVFGESDKGEQ